MPVNDIWRCYSLLQPCRPRTLYRDLSEALDYWTHGIDFTRTTNDRMNGWGLWITVWTNRTSEFELGACFWFLSCERNAEQSSLLVFHTICCLLDAFVWITFCDELVLFQSHLWGGSSMQLSSLNSISTQFNRRTRDVRCGLSLKEWEGGEGRMVWSDHGLNGLCSFK